MNVMQGAKNSALLAAIGAVGSYATGFGVAKVQFLKDQPYAVPALLFAAGHLLKQKSPMLGQTLCVLSGPALVMAAVSAGVLPSPATLGMGAPKAAKGYYASGYDDAGLGAGIDAGILIDPNDVRRLIGSSQTAGYHDAGIVLQPVHEAMGL